ncbi:diguanylate cyclase (GGDEF)-like protein [Silvimonas terrae]|uniref:Diguanylate cyclase (GGDEF)-like protein n=1 Tax=Silvimonas terrae TaxID=300266 RepID=A0A840RFI3_9NEIS|nr:diguanylate cyclase [Silvimonas terrae]MBB5192095.1 diguanylate cyclase (GGDEF)-like protein [Silvimonas terrae]
MPNVPVSFVWFLAASGWVVAVLALIAWYFERTRHKTFIVKQARRAGLDVQTGLSSRDRFLADAGASINRAQRTHSSICVLLVCVEKLEQLEQGYGPLARDMVLRQLATLCRTNVRDFDIVGRFSPSEVALVLMDIDLPGAHVVANRLVNRKPAQMVTLPDARVINFSLEWGLAQLRSEADTIEDLMLAADADLVACRNRKNRPELQVIAGGKAVGVVGGI